MLQTGLLILLSYTLQDCQPRCSVTHSDLSLLKSTISQGSNPQASMTVAFSQGLLLPNDSNSCQIDKTKARQSLWHKLSVPGEEEQLRELLLALSHSCPADVYVLKGLCQILRGSYHIYRPRVTLLKLSLADVLLAVTCFGEVRRK